jgi:hypothetical protein
MGIIQQGSEGADAWEMTRTGAALHERVDVVDEWRCVRSGNPWRFVGVVTSSGSSFAFL